MATYQVTSEHGTREVSPVYAYAFSAALGTVRETSGKVELWAARDGKRLGFYPVASWLNGHRLQG